VYSFIIITTPYSTVLMIDICSGETSTPLIKCKHDEDDDDDDDDNDDDDDDDIVNGDDSYNEVTKREIVIDI